MSVNNKKPVRLGRGLSSLMNQPIQVSPPAGDAEQAAAVDVPRETVPDGGGPTDNDTDLRRIAVEAITPNRYQPRQTFNEDALESLAQSIKTQGLMQPVLLRPQQDGMYVLVAGERRWRAAKKAGLASIPALIRNLTDQESAELAIVENVQREDLNPIDRAEAFNRLVEEFGLTHEQVAEKVGLERSSISNLLRLLKLGPTARQLVRDGLLNMGQARVLAGVQDPDNQAMLGERSVRENLSVRQVEALARALTGGQLAKADRGRAVAKSANLVDLERQITEQIGSKTQIKPGKKKNTGSLTIQYASHEEFEALCERLAVRLTH